MSDPKPSVKLSPRRPLTHNEMIFDIVDLPPNEEITLNITGPIPQPYWVSLKSDPFGQAQLIWRTQAAGDYALKVKGEGVSLSESFKIHYQQGEEDAIARGLTEEDADVKTVEEPGNMGDRSSTEMRAPEPTTDDPAVDDPQYKSAKAPAKKKGTKK